MAARPRWLALALLLAPLAPLAAQTADSVPLATMSGRVFDVETGLPIPGVTVTVRELQRSAMTNHMGGFVMEGLAPGEHTWLFRRLGYADWEGQSLVKDGDWFTVRMLPRPELLAGITVVADGFRRRRESASVSARVLDQGIIAASGTGNARQLVNFRSNLLFVSCPGDRLEIDCINYRGHVVRPGLFVDDEPMPGGLVGLYAIPTSDIHLVEIFSFPESVSIFVTTHLYAERLARTRNRPKPLLLARVGVGAGRGGDGGHLGAAHSEWRTQDRQPPADGPRTPASRP